MISEAQILMRIEQLKELVPEFKKVQTEQLKVFFGQEKKKSLKIPEKNVANIMYYSPTAFALWIDETYFENADQAERDRILLHEMLHVFNDREEHGAPFEDTVENYLKIVRQKEGR